MNRLKHTSSRPTRPIARAWDKALAALKVRQRDPTTRVRCNPNQTARVRHRRSRTTIVNV